MKKVIEAEVNQINTNKQQINTKVNVNPYMLKPATFKMSH